MFASTASNTPTSPTITITAPPPVPAVTAQGMSAITTPTTIKNDTASQHHNADEGRRRTLERSDSVAIHINSLKPADSDRV